MYNAELCKDINNDVGIAIFLFCSDSHGDMKIMKNNTSVSSSLALSELKS
jgi:hypothetical protein